MPDRFYRLFPSQECEPGSHEAHGAEDDHVDGQGHGAHDYQEGGGVDEHHGVHAGLQSRVAGVAGLHRVCGRRVHQQRDVLQQPVMSTVTNPRSHIHSL